MTTPERETAGRLDGERTWLGVAGQRQTGVELKVDAGDG